MDFRLIEADGRVIAEVPKGTHTVGSAQDALELIANAEYQGATHVLLHEDSLSSAFFDLKSGLAGEIVQKHSNYRMGLIILGEFEKYESESLQAFIRECNRGDLITFVAESAGLMQDQVGRLQPLDE